MVNLSFKELDFLNLIEFSKKVPQSEVLFIYYSLSSSSTLILNSLSCSSSATAGAFVIGQTALWFLGNAITSVSYTHLDVYKRQRLSRSLSPLT